MDFLLHNKFNRYKIDKKMIDDIIKNNNLDYDFINDFKPRNFYIYKNNLFYKYKDKYLKIIPSEDIDMVIEKIFNKNKVGRDALFQLIKDKYLGISRRKINKFIQKKNNFM